MNRADSRESPLSARAKLSRIRTDRAGKHDVYDQGMLRLKRRGGGFHWIALNGDRILSGARLFDARRVAAQVHRRHGARRPIIRG